MVSDRGQGTAWSQDREGEWPPDPHLETLCPPSSPESSRANPSGEANETPTLPLVPTYEHKAASRKREPWLLGAGVQIPRDSLTCVPKESRGIQHIRADSFVNNLSFYQTEGEEIKQGPLSEMEFLTAVKINELTTQVIEID